jgi:hypothetical protein
MRQSAKVQPVELASTKIPELPIWALSFINQDKEGLSASHRVAILGKITELATTGDWEGLNGILKHIPIEKLSTGTLILLLRGTFRFKSKLPNWLDVRDGVQTELIARKENAERLLMGL